MYIYLLSKCTQFLYSIHSFLTAYVQVGVLTKKYNNV